MLDACVHTASAYRQAPTWTHWETQYQCTTTRRSSTGGHATTSMVPIMATAWSAGSTKSPQLVCACGPVSWPSHACHLSEASPLLGKWARNTVTSPQWAKVPKCPSPPKPYVKHQDWGQDGGLGEKL